MSIATRAVTFLMTVVALVMVIAMVADGRLRHADVPVVAMPSDEPIQATGERNGYQYEHRMHGCRGYMPRR